MARFSATAAAGAGFDLIARRPLTVAAWGLLVFVTSTLPAAALYAWAGPSFLAYMGAVMRNPDTASMSPEYWRFENQSNLISALSMPLSLVGGAVLYAAILRAVLQPSNRAFAYLRLGMREVWLVLVSLASALLLLPFLYGFIALVALLIYMIAVHSVAAYVVAAMGLALMWATIWVGARLSLAAPMTFEAGEFRLFESWAVTRGHAFGLFCLGLLQVFLVLVLELLFAVALVALVAAFGARFDLHTLQAPDRLLRSMGDSMSASGPWLLAAGLVWSMLIAVIDAVFIAAWAAAYRMLKPAEAASDA